MKLELFIPDQAASNFSEFFHLGGKEVFPSWAEFDRFGGFVEFDGVRYVADQDALETYPAPGTYYFTAA